MRSRLKALKVCALHRAFLGLPALMEETDYIFAYLERNASLGLRFAPGV